MSNHQTIQLKIINNSNPFNPTFASSGTIKLNMPFADSGALRIVRYQGLNVFSSPTPIFISFSSGAINTSPVINGSNDFNNIGSSTEFMLPVVPDVTGGLNSSWEFDTPIEIMSGDNLTNGSREIHYNVRDQFGNPYGFGALFIVLDFIPVSRYNSEIGGRQVKPTEYKEVVARNHQFFPFSSERAVTDFVNY